MYDFYDLNSETSDWNAYGLKDNKLKGGLRVLQVVPRKVTWIWSASSSYKHWRCVRRTSTDLTHYHMLSCVHTGHFVRTLRGTYRNWMISPQTQLYHVTTPDVYKARPVVYAHYVLFVYRSERNALTGCNRTLAKSSHSYWINGACSSHHRLHSWCQLSKNSDGRV